MTALNTFTLEDFATGARRTVTAPGVWEALDSQPEPCFTVVKKSDGRFAALSPENDAFIALCQHEANTAEEAAESIREHYAAIKGAMH